MPQGSLRLFNMSMRPMTVPATPKAGREARGGHEEGGAGLVARLRCGDLGLEDLADDLGVGAVDGHLDALAQERVLDLLGSGLEREQALLAGGLGESEQLGDGLARVGLLRPASGP